MTSLPQRIGRYEVVGQLATGGMAQILLGRVTGPSGFERPVVIKRILPHLAEQPEFHAMFLDEARTISRIRHQNVVQVMELGQEGQELFLVMEYLEGEPASNLLRRLKPGDQRLDCWAAAYVVAEACAGLHAAHELRTSDDRPLELVHRDISPQNVFITYGGEVKVIDFGIAMSADRIARTQAGQIKGKFQYMSPEQCRGMALDRRSDVYALGIVLFELVTGKHLFKRATDALTVAAVIAGKIPAPSQYLPDCPSALEQVCLKALSRHARDRYQTAADMRRDLMKIVHELCPTRMPADELSALMNDLFADIIDEKREALRRVENGSVLVQIPISHTDELDTPPAAPDTNTDELDSLQQPGALSGPPGAKRAQWRMAIGTAGVVGIAAPLLVWSLLRSPTAPTAADSAATVASSSASLPLSGSAQALAGEVKVHVQTSPQGATVLVDGVDQGKTPVELRVASGPAPIAVEMRLDGFAVVRQSVVPDMDQKLVLTLVPEARPQALGTQGPRATTRPAPVPAPTTSRGFRRYD